jgi:hypothetical protein
MSGRGTAGLVVTGVPSGWPPDMAEETLIMKKNIAVVTLALVFVMNMGSGSAQRPNRQLFKIESSLFDKLDDRLGTDVSLETERKFKSCVLGCDKT